VGAERPGLTELGLKLVCLEAQWCVALEVPLSTQLVHRDTSIEHHCMQALCRPLADLSCCPPDRREIGSLSAPSDEAVMWHKAPAPVLRM
jgi:hypothetical protein